MLRNSHTHYGAVSRALHWAIACSMTALFALGWYMTELSYYDPWYKLAFDWHKSAGILFLGLAAARLLWAMAERPVAAAHGTASWQRGAARGAHYLLYVMTLVVPVSGYLISTAKGDAISVFGWFEVPALLPSVDQGEELAGQLHYYLAFGTAYLVGLHALAAAKHQFLDRDGTLGRMISGPTVPLQPEGRNAR